MPKPRFLCLHGRPSSGEIFEFQTLDLSDSVDIDCVFINAPFALQKPDPYMSNAFPGFSLYEWHPRVNPNEDEDDEEDVTNQGEVYKQEIVNKTNESLEYIASKFKELGPFDGLLGFSTGAEMITRLVHRFEKLVKCIILIGGVLPHNIEEKDLIKSVPSLHILSRKDEYFSYGLRLVELYTEQNRSILYHDEGHKIPSRSTNLYPTIQQWIRTYVKSTQSPIDVSQPTFTNLNAVSDAHPFIQNENKPVADTNNCCVMS